VRLANTGDGSWESLIQDSDPLAGPAGPQDENATAHIFYTGGTTGRAKGVMLSHRNVAASSNNKIMLGQFARDDVWLHAAPMFHQADSWACFSFTAVGAAHVFIPRFTPGDALDLIESHRVTASQFVPTMVLMMLETEGIKTRDLASVRRILYGSAPMPTETLKRCQAVFGDVFQHIYGLTEAAGTVATTPWPPEPGETGGARMASCGQPIAGVDMRIADGDGMETATGTVGRIQVKGATIMSGYWGREAETAAAFVDDWLDTGDLGHMDEDGFVFIVDRAKDMIITGGENVYSVEVEDAIMSHPAVLEAAVIGAPDEEWGEAVLAVVALKPEASVTESELRDACKERIAAFKVPKRVEFVDALPKTGAGKVYKKGLRGKFWEGVDRRVG
jgi:long-chain acyl-CoA synthetase